jgi:ABC-type lipoprotein release transport system permease subunit
MTAIGVEGLGGTAPITVLDGRVPLGPNEVALGTGSMHQLGLHVGDRTTIAGGCGQRDVQVVGRVSMPLIGTADPDDGTLLPLDTFRALCSDQLVASVDSNTSILVRLRHPSDAAALRRQFDPRQFLVQSRFTPGAVRAIDDVRQVPLVVAVLVALQALAAVAHALALAVRRRRGDLAVLRALGLRPGQTAGVVRWQSLTLAAVAVVIGLPVGVVGGRLLWSMIAGSSHLVVRADVVIWGLALVAAGIVAGALGASVWSGHRAARLHPAEILRSE